MSATQELTQEQEAVTQVVEQHFDDLSKTDGLDAAYKLAAVSASASVGPGGAHMKGWATYLAVESGKIHFVAGRITLHKGLFAGAGADPVMSVRDPRELAGRTGNFRIWGSGGSGFLQMWVNGRQVFASPLVLVGVGIGAWTAEGDVSFHYYP